jgi:hypothetical protein
MPDGGGEKKKKRKEKNPGPEGGGDAKIQNESHIIKKYIKI